MIKITILNDNSPGRGFWAEHGLSFFIEFDNKKILLDAGPGEVFLKNAGKLNINLKNLDALVLSHGHWDHGNGFKFLQDVPLYAHPHVFKKRYHTNREKDYVGLEMSQKEFENKFKLHLSVKPIEIFNNCWFLGEIPRVNDFESKTTAFVDEEGLEDFIPDDSGLALVSQYGLIVISGCAHAGIINTIEYAQTITGINRVHAVLGGFHLKKANEITHRTIEQLKDLKVSNVLPSHCTDLPALSKFYEAFGLNQIRTGNVYTF